MMERYYCLKEKKFVLTRLDMFKHPHMGMKSCYVCRECGSMVFPEEEEEKDA